MMVLVTYKSGSQALVDMAADDFIEFQKRLANQHISKVKSMTGDAFWADLSEVAGINFYNPTPK